MATLSPTAHRLRTAATGLLILWLVAPMIPLAIWSFARGWRFPHLLPQDWTLRAWDYALSPTAGVTASLGLTAFIATATSLLALAIGIPAGRALGMDRFRGRGLIETVILAPAIVPGIAVALGLHRVFLGLGLTGTTGGVILVHLIPTLPYVTLVMAGVFASLDPEAGSQARSLGASRLQVLRHVTLPAIVPGVIAAGLLGFLVSWSQYILTLMIGGGRVATLPLVLFSFATSGRMDIAGAIGVIYVAPGILVLAVAARGLTGRGPLIPGSRRSRATLAARRSPARPVAGQTAARPPR